jgi:hypothetical protein
MDNTLAFEELAERCRALRPYAPQATVEWLDKLVEANDWDRLERALASFDSDHPGRSAARAEFEDRLAVLALTSDFSTVSREKWLAAWRSIFQRDFKSAMEMAFAIGPQPLAMDDPARPA